MKKIIFLIIFVFTSNAILSKEYDENSDYYQAENWKRGWHQFQTEVIKKENNSIKIKFYNDVLIDNIELWVPIY